MNKRIILNATVSILQVVSMGFAAFIVYKIVLVKLGAKDLGIWSLVFSVSSVANVANLGVASSLIKFIASYHQKENWQHINKLIGTGFVIVCTFMGMVVGLLFLLKRPILLLMLSEKDLSIGVQIFPLSLASLWINTSGAVVLAVLDGLKQTYKRSLIYICSSLVLTFTTYFIIDIAGLRGLGYAQILQGIFVLVTAWVVLLKSSSQISIFSMRVEKTAFKEIFSYSIKFQFISLINIFIEPATKFLLSRYGTLSDVGYFEMSNRLVAQVRQLMVSANQVIIPWVAQGDGTREFIVKIYKKNFDIVSIFGFLCMSSLILLLPLISNVWIGHYNIFFITSGLILTLSHLVNIHTFPANFTNLGIGNLNHLIYTALIFCILNCVFGALFGFYFGGMGVIAGWAIALLSGSSFQMYLFRREYKIRFSDVYTLDIYYRIISILVSLAALLAYGLDLKWIIVLSFLGFTINLLLSYFGLIKSTIFDDLKLFIQNRFKPSNQQ